MAKSVRIPPKVRLLLFSILAISWCTGILFFTLNRWFPVAGEFGFEKNPWQFPVLKFHAAAAFAMMVFFGYLLASHILVSFPVKRMRPTGLTLYGMYGFLILSAYGLYYSGNDVLRTPLAYGHAAIGFCFPFVLAFHLILGRRGRHPKRRPLSPELSDS